MSDNKINTCKDCMHWDGIGFAENAGWCEEKNIGTLYNDSCGDFDDKDDYNQYENENEKFIWGVKSWDDLCGSDACLYTMNDIDIIYDKKRKVYMLGIETAYMFETHAAECEYLKDCLNAFTKYMDDNGLNKNMPYMLFMSNPCTSMTAETIEELYTNFKIFVDGFCSLNTNVNNIENY